MHAQKDDFPAPGEFIAKRYQVIRLLGVGATSAVFLVRLTVSNELFALKILRTDFFTDERASLRFEREATALSKIVHPNLISLHGIGRSDNGAPYFVMEFFHGTNLSRILEEEGKLDVLRACHIFSQICVGMQAAHNAGVLHRDLKPGNILLAKEQPLLETVKIVDFGIAKTADERANDMRLTEDGCAVGTPGYMSPEQGSGLALDQRSDIYSLGCIMYAALSGQAPFHGDHGIALIFKHVTEVPKPMSAIDPALARYPDLERIVAKTLAKRVEDRYQSMSELNKDIVDFSEKLES